MLGSGSTHSMFLGLKAQILVKWNVKTPQNVAAECESLGLSTLDSKCKISLSLEKYMGFWRTN